MFTDNWTDPEDKTKVETENQSTKGMAAKLKADTATAIGVLKAITNTIMESGQRLEIREISSQRIWASYNSMIGFKGHRFSVKHPTSLSRLFLFNSPTCKP